MTTKPEASSLKRKKRRESCLAKMIKIEKVIAVFIPLLPVCLNSNPIKHLPLALYQNCFSQDHQ